MIRRLFNVASALSFGAALIVALAAIVFRPGPFLVIDSGDGSWGLMIYDGTFALYSNHFVGQERGASRLIVPLMILPLAWAIATCQRKWRRRKWVPGLCPVCGYDLRASNDRCPECGTPIPSNSRAPV